jgi:hypothetical protein
MIALSKLSFESSIVCAMKVREEFGVTSPGIGVAVKPKFGTQVQRVGFVTLSKTHLPLLLYSSVFIILTNVEKDVMNSEL